MVCSRFVRRASTASRRVSTPVSRSSTLSSVASSRRCSASWGDRSRSWRFDRYIERARNRSRLRAGQQDVSRLAGLTLANPQFDRVFVDAPTSRRRRDRAHHRPRPARTTLLPWVGPCVCEDPVIVGEATGGAAQGLLPPRELWTSCGRRPPVTCAQKSHAASV